MSSEVIRSENRTRHWRVHGPSGSTHSKSIEVVTEERDSGVKSMTLTIGNGFTAEDIPSLVKLLQTVYEESVVQR